MYLYLQVREAFVSCTVGDVTMMVIAQSLLQRGWRPVLTAIARIGLVLFAVEFLVMLVLPYLAKQDGVETWFATLEDAFLLAFVATPLIINWSLKNLSEIIKIIKSDYPSGFVLFNVGFSVFAVVFSVECGIMLLIPAVGFAEKSFALAALDAALLATVASPVVFFFVVLDRWHFFSFANNDKMRNVRRQFFTLFLPQLLLFFLITEALYFQESRSREKLVESEDALWLKLIRDGLWRELDYLAGDLLVLANHATSLQSIQKKSADERQLVEDLLELLRTKMRFQSAFLVDVQGKIRIHVDFQGEQATEVVHNSSDDRLPETPREYLLKGGEFVVSGPFVPSNGKQGVPVLRIGTPVVDKRGDVVGMVFLDGFWSNFESILKKTAPSLSGGLYLFSENKGTIFPFSGTMAGPPSGSRLWSMAGNVESGRIVDREGVLLFARLHPEVRSLAAPWQTDGVVPPGFTCQWLGFSWKVVSWISPDRQDFRLDILRKRLLIFQSLLVALAALGSWFFSRAIVNHREADARNDRAYQSRITLSSLLETALVSMGMEEQLRYAIQIVGTTPWLGLTGKGAVFISDPELGQMVLVAQVNLGDREARQVEKVSLSRCLCQVEGNWRRTIQFPQDDPSHSTCLKSESGEGYFCIPIPGAHGLIGVMSMQLQKGHVSQDEDAFFSTVAGTLSGIITRRRMELELQEKHAELRKTRLDVIHRLGMAAEYRDQDTGLHVVRMSKYAEILARASNFSEEFCEIIVNAAPMHDVGKIGIPDHILLKPARLEDHEREIMKKHTLIGSAMLHGYDAEPMNTAHIIALTHHERWDGAGYPIGVPGEEIPVEGRICAIADVFDALTSDRPYKAAWSPEEALEEIRKGSGTAFDPQLVATFIKVFPEIMAVKQSHDD